ncbi:MAG: hypothetical protein K8S56_08205 [Candidatus Cloacimonetes bacterium]|nr:hypothetical protein [Candidatus Cloacimonadota bacterium]
MRIVRISVLLVLTTVLMVSCGITVDFVDGEGRSSKKHKASSYDYYLSSARELARQEKWIDAAFLMEEALSMKQSGEGYYLTGFFYSKAALNTMKEHDKWKHYKAARKHLRMALDWNYTAAQDMLDDINVILKT